MRLQLGLWKTNEPTTSQLWGNRADRPVTNPAKPTNSVPYFYGRSFWKKRRIFFRVWQSFVFVRSEKDGVRRKASRPLTLSDEKDQQIRKKAVEGRGGETRKWPKLSRNYRNRNSRYRPVKQHPTHGGIEPRPSRTNQKVLKVTTYKLKASS